MRTGILFLTGALLAAGCSAFPHSGEAPHEITYTCAHGHELAASIEGEHLELTLNGARARLQATDVAYGARYASPGGEIAFWTRDDAAMLEMAGVFWSCRAVDQRQ
nr:MliC family protein [Thioalkalivibrio sp. ALJT]